MRRVCPRRDKTDGLEGGGIGTGGAKMWGCGPVTMRDLVSELDASHRQLEIEADRWKRDSRRRDSD